MNKFLFLLTTICFSLVVTAQTDSALANLTKAQPDQLGGQLMLTPEVSLYDADMQTIDMNRFFELSQSGKFIPEAYIDDAENLKALVLKPATKEEIMELRKKMGSSIPFVIVDPFLKNTFLFIKAEPLAVAIQTPKVERLFPIGFVI